jgi:DNA/RNA endonuclease G (NUC1)
MSNFLKDIASITPLHLVIKTDFIPFQRQTEKYFLSPSVHSLPSSYSTSVSVNDGFVIYYDTRTRNPLCVVEKLTRRPEGNDHLKRPPFYSEPTLDSSYFRVHPNEYINSKYDRGHMVAAADFSFEPNLYKETFTMCNISPQVMSVHRG